MESEQPCDVIEAERTFFKLLISCNDIFFRFFSFLSSSSKSHSSHFIRKIADFFSFFLIFQHFLILFSPVVAVKSSGKLKSSMLNLATINFIKFVQWSLLEMLRIILSFRTIVLGLIMLKI